MGATEVAAEVRGLRAAAEVRLRGGDGGPVWPGAARGAVA